MTLWWSVIILKAETNEFVSAFYRLANYELPNFMRD